MGLEFSHGDAHWSYSSFNTFRRRLARLVNIDLDRMFGFGLHSGESGGVPWPDPDSDPIIFLLNHSDCDGELTADECRLVAPRLRQLVEQWPADDWDRCKAEQLAAGMDAAALADEPLEFC